MSTSRVASLLTVKAADKSAASHEADKNDFVLVSRSSLSGAIGSRLMDADSKTPDAAKSVSGETKTCDMIEESKDKDPRESPFILTNDSLSTGRSGGRGKGKMGKQKLPPQLNASIHQLHKYRFANSSQQVGVSVSVGSLLGAAGSVCTVANTTITSFNTACRILKIEVWPSTAASGTTFANVYWFSDVNMPDDEHDSRIPQGVTLTRSMVFHPPKHSRASFWWQSSATSQVLFKLGCSAFSVVDVTMETTLSNNLSGVSQTVATATLGLVYYGYLDGTTHAFQPIGLPNTT